MAAAKPLSLGQKILREELSCSICLELFTRPKMLPCQHTFCQDCLQVYFAELQEPLRCPSCRLKVSLPPEGVTGLPDNISATKLCKKLQATEESAKEAAENRNKCRIHPSEQPELYCRQCNVPVCYTCLDEFHDGHSMTSIKTITKERKPAVQSLLTEGKDILENYCSALLDMRMEEKRLNEQKKQRDKDIIDAYERTLKEFEQTANRLRLRVQEKHTENTDAMQQQMDIVQRQMDELSAICDAAEQEMAQGGEEFLMHEGRLTQVVEKHRGATLPPPLRTQVIAFHPRNLNTLEANLGQIVVPQPNSKGRQRGQAERVTFGGRGSDVGQFDTPIGVAVSEEGEIYVADHSNKRVQVFTLQGTFVRQFPTVASGEQCETESVVLGAPSESASEQSECKSKRVNLSEQPASESVETGEQKMYPHDVAMDGEGNLWVVGATDTAHVAVQYDKQGRVLRKIDLQTTNRFRTIAVDTKRNHILVTKAAGQRRKWHGEVQVFRPDGTLVRTVGDQWGKQPRYLTIDKEGNVLVSNFTPHSVVVLNQDGEFLFKFGTEGNGGNRLSTPHGICTMKSGNIVLCDINVKGCRRVALFDSAGRFLKNITTEMRYPWAVAMATEGQLVVTDCKDHTITIFNNIQ